MKNLVHETQQSSKTNKRESLQPTDISEEINEEGNVVDSDEIDNWVDPQQKKIISSDVTILCNILIQKSE